MQEWTSKQYEIQPRPAEGVVLGMQKTTEPREIPTAEGEGTGTTKRTIGKAAKTI